MVFHGEISAVPYFFPILTVLATFLESQISNFFFHFPTPYFLLNRTFEVMSGLDNSAKTRHQPIRHCLGAVLQYLAIFYENQH